MPSTKAVMRQTIALAPPATVYIGNDEAGDAEEPASEARVVTAASDAANGAEENLLGRLLRFLLASQPARRVVVDARGV